MFYFFPLARRCGLFVPGSTNAFNENRWLAPIGIIHLNWNTHESESFRRRGQDLGTYLPQSPSGGLPAPVPGGCSSPAR